jgi:uncharacterized membrane protein YagU involved in acid resistance
MKPLLRGLVAGVAGTGVMTAYQVAVARLQDKPISTPVPERWEDAPAPAQAAKKLADALGQGRRLTRQDVPLLTNVMHWLYGIGWAAVYSLTAARRAPAPVLAGVELGTGVWTASYVQLVPLGIYQPPWKYPAKVIALDLSYHLVYGLAVAGVYAALRDDFRLKAGILRV